ncbi:hypothetical protein COEREDRAFT_46856 [Coemansia reversa NRRL 1564]|uniref:Methylmalonic aciduria and homocystinuria type D protein n=1 Tax=Coemansia reversa (strain ATCC 12441 / NRRL 1564) TaxID=763665 RepID=A0A2G5B601_COERN|nr:hypothetical protein COEREDRAFT_46856 [Coemansia reversa NRRL 1564]|eukprot:PIA14422.1 hypothetical protein COEREDRAFT_46856 [Coemansia reversa NRRL 1564]
MIQAKPLVATFPLLPQLPKSLDDLQVDITTDNSAVILQYSVHVCPRSMRREMSLVFPDIVGKESRLLIIPTFQRTLSSMISYEVETQAEKDAKLHLFYRWGAELVDRLHAQGHWADITDPMSGMALFTSCGPSLYPDVEGAEALLRYTPFNLGSCFVMSHPQWGTHVYPATAFTLAPAEVVTRTLCEMQLSLQ